MKTLGIHTLVELFGCDYNIINDVKKIKEIMVEAAKATRAQIIKTAFHKFNPHGVSGVVVIAESHLTIHSWPEHGYAAVDIFTCSPLMKLEKALKYLKKNLKASKIIRVEIKRGFLEK